ncbi:MAG: 23S rRNA pseudouridine(1911/1915/1917) synthase RluD [Thiotrichales bacterium]
MRVTDSDLAPFAIPSEFAGQRLDQALAALVPGYSRARLQRWIKRGAITVDGAVSRCKHRLAGGELVELELPDDECLDDFAPEPMALEVVHEDASLVVINKPPGLVVHPAAGNWSGTLLNGLLDRYPELSAVPRAGIVHRLDKDTSGLLVVARTLTAHKHLVAALEARTVSRTYAALVEGQLVAGGTVSAPIARHPVDRKRMAVVQGGKTAVTHYRIARRYAAHTLLEVRLETGRTHQIRVHMAYLRHPVVGDPVYPGRLRLPKNADPALVAALQGLRRQALHATRLAFEHPETHQAVSWEAALPDDFACLLQALEPYQAP